MNITQLMNPTAIIYGLSIFSMFGIYLLIMTSAKRLRQRQLFNVATEEDGAAYTISYVMVIPVFALLICILIETASLFPAKIGSVYAAFAAARTANVWSTATDWDNAEKKAEAAGRRAFVPFASATQGFDADSVSTESARYFVANEHFSDAEVKGKYLLAKFAFAQAAVDVTVSKPKSWDDAITAKVTYKFPFNVPGVARIFGEQSEDGSYYFPIASEVTLNNEAPQNKITSTEPTNNSLGIGYGILE